MTPEPLDQTRGDSTPFLSNGQTACLSQNEVAALCMKAARGAGMAWGLAEEAGFAAAWLVQHGIDGPHHLLAHLTQAQGRGWTDLCPTVAPGDWSAPAGGGICPIALGATLCDYATLPEGPALDCALRVGAVDHPVLVIPFLAAVTDAAGILIELGWGDETVCIGADPDALAQAAEALSGQQTPLVLTARPGPPKPVPDASAPHTPAETLSALNVLAMRTTVPPSDASRAGAGSATSDND